MTTKELHQPGVACVLAAIAIAVCTGTWAAPPVATPEPPAELRAALSSLTDHIEGKKKLDATQIEAHNRIIDTHRDIFGSNAAIIKAACDLVATYDKVNGPLWVAHKGFIRTQVNRRTLGPPATDIHWTIFTVMQAIMDRVYTADNVARHAALLNGFKFGSSAYFPGAVEPPTNSTATYMVKINASCPKPFVHVVMHEDIPARRPTGAYLAPGSIATVTVPPSIVGKGYTIRVGTHSWDFAKKPKVVRVDRSSLVYPIDSTNVNVASPLGGGIYIEVPLRANAAGIIDVAIRNAVRSPYFSAKPFHQTSLEEWKSVERNCKAPWADFQTEKFMMQVPSSWIRTLDDPATLMKNWDLAMDAMNDLMGLPHAWGKETMYCQVDLLIRAAAYAPGYPTLNDGYDPKKDYNSYTNHYLVRGPHCVPSHVFHEAGHGYFFVKFAEEAESTVNLLHVAVCNRQFGYSLDDAFADSRGKSTYRTLDSTAIEWMTSFNFIDTKPMEREEKAYQHKGHAKYVDTARLFGWNVLGDFWHSWVADEEQGKTVSRHETDIDVLNLRLSQSAGVDLTPLLHFWGTPPRDATPLKKAVAAAKLPPSPKVYDTLTHYAALVPPDNKAFRDCALKLWNKMPSTNGYTTERGHARQWNEYDEKTAARITNVVREIIATYFPDGRPASRP